MVKRSKIRAVELKKWVERGIIGKWCLGSVVGAKGGKYGVRLKAS